MLRAAQHAHQRFKASVWQYVLQAVAHDAASAAPGTRVERESADVMRSQLQGQHASNRICGSNGRHARYSLDCTRRGTKDKKFGAWKHGSHAVSHVDRTRQLRRQCAPAEFPGGVYGAGVMRHACEMQDTPRLASAGFRKQPKGKCHLRFVSNVDLQSQHFTTTRCAQPTQPRLGLRAHSTSKQGNRAHVHVLHQESRVQQPGRPESPENGQPARLRQP